MNECDILKIFPMMTVLISLHLSEGVAKKKKGFNNGFVQDLELLTVLESEYVNISGRIMKELLYVVFTECQN